MAHRHSREDYKAAILATYQWTSCQQKYQIEAKAEKIIPGLSFHTLSNVMSEMTRDGTLRLERKGNKFLFHLSKELKHAGRKTSNSNDSPMECSFADS
jgi:hypothetical protein